MVTLRAGGRTITVRTAPARDGPYVLFPSIGEYPVYDDPVYAAFDAPDQRVRAYRSAIAASVPGRTVVDVGTGRDALWALAAARAGAAHVHAIEAQPEVAVQARRAVAAAGLTDRVTVLDGLSTRINLPRPAQVCISEIVGNIASAEGAITALADARARLCADDCVWIPFRIQTWAAAVDLPAGACVLATESLPYLRGIFDSVGHPFDLRLCLGGPAADRIISDAVPVESIVFDHRRAPPPVEFAGAADLTLDPAATRLTGLLLWTRVAASAGTPEIDTLTGDTRSWAPVYVPLSLTGVPVRGGDRLRLTLDRRTSDDGRHPDYRLVLGDALSWTSPHHGRAFRASAFYRRLFPSGGG